MPRLFKALFMLALALGIASTIVASTHQTSTSAEAADATGRFGLYGTWNEGEEPVTPFLPLPDAGTAAESQQNNGVRG
jgi:hypothetical protein